MQQELPGELLLELKSIVLSYIKEFIQYHRPYSNPCSSDLKTGEMSEAAGACEIGVAREAGETGTGNLLKDFAGSFNYFSPQHCFKIGGLVIKNSVISAPLAGISDSAYRIFASAFGSALNFTEMISSYGLHYKHSESLLLAGITKQERPCAVQLFGCDPAILSEAAEIVEQYGDMVDINMGCPVPKVLKAKSGGFLLTDEENIAKIISAMTDRIKKPVTVKVRLGWDKNSINIENVAKIAEACGAGAITIHGRTVKQGFTGEADYSHIRKVKNIIKIPVIVSGDIDSPAKAKQVLDETGCDGVMIGRAAKGNHWIFFDILAALGIEDPEGENSFTIEADRYFRPSIGFKQRFAKLYIRILIDSKGEEKAVREFRKHLAWIFKGVHKISRVKNDFFSVSSYEDTIKVINSIS
jgi:tRNA-dihydrouridine synthase B